MVAAILASGKGNQALVHPPLGAMQPPVCTAQPPTITVILDDPEAAAPFWVYGERFCNPAPQLGPPGGTLSSGEADCSGTTFTLSGGGRTVILDVVSVVVGARSSCSLQFRSFRPRPTSH